jgi:hypothetical protein
LITAVQTTPGDVAEPKQTIALLDQYAAPDVRDCADPALDNGERHRGNVAEANERGGEES